jgi:hypothetical protein
LSKISDHTHIYVNVFSLKGEKLVAACDEDILGKTFREGKMKLEILENFYKGDRLTLKEAIQVLQSADIANLSGTCIVNATIDSGLADNRSIIFISGVPHLQILKF